MTGLLFPFWFVVLLVLNLICEVSLLKNIRPVARICITLLTIPINATRNIAGNIILETHSDPMMLDLLIFVSVLCLIQAIKLEQVSIKASDLCFCWIEHFDAEAGFCHAKSKNSILDAVAIFSPRFAFCFLVEGWIAPILDRKLLDKLDAIVIQTRATLPQAILKNLPVVNPLPPVFDEGISLDIGFPRCMDACEREKKTLKNFRIVNWL